MPEAFHQRIIIIAGPNGAGKTTFAREFLPNEANCPFDAKLIPIWQRNGYRVHLIFLRLKNEELAIERVAVRVVQGGHDVDGAVIRRRFKQGWANFQNIYRELVDSWQLYDNSGERAKLIDEGS
ncbi:MAG TPA: hypothetical protein VJ180_04920 [Pyrinomonadaceae bacterium]|nr:hypothetical protein [Pyrinomonadaceae bacterium]